MYSGKLGRTVMKGEAKRAYMLWECQRDRCNNKHRKFYKSYGGRGIKVEYSSREFVSWWLKNSIGHSGNLTCGRINHDDNYRFGNIKVETRLENVKEQYQRLGNPNPPKKVAVFKDKTNELLFIAESTREAADKTKCRQSHISEYCNGIYKPHNGFRYQFLDMIEHDLILSVK